MPLFVVFQMPPAAAATKKVLEGDGMPTTSVTRPSKFAGPTGRHGKPRRVSESSVWACRADVASVAPAARARTAGGLDMAAWVWARWCGGAGDDGDTGSGRLVLMPQPRPRLAQHPVELPTAEPPPADHHPVDPLRVAHVRERV